MLRRGWCRSFHFASSRFRRVLADTPLPIAPADQLRASTINYLNGEFDPKKWYDDPITTTVKGIPLVCPNDHIQSTVDAFGKENGVIRLASPDVFDKLQNHLSNLYANPLPPPSASLTEKVRAVEKKLLWDCPHILIGNQAMDFMKQDGVTEIEESVQANLIEQKLNDHLLCDEQKGRISICRAPVLVGCVSNFSNFLDLSRKTLRNVEVGVPAVILSRSNTTQHMYRWYQLMEELFAQEGIDSGLITYAAISIEQTQQLFERFPKSPMHITCSREVAKAVREKHANVLSSTGGPNTLCAPRFTEEIKDAVLLSATIENSGQCTALRHACVGGISDVEAESVFDNSESLKTPRDALEKGAFSGIFDDAPFSLSPEYQATKSNFAFRVSQHLPPDGIDEKWRMAYVDFSSPRDFGY